MFGCRRNVVVSFMVVNFFVGFSAVLSAVEVTDETRSALLQESCPELFKNTHGWFNKIVNVAIPAILGGCIGRVLGVVGLLAGLGFGAYVGATTGLQQKGIWKGCAQSMAKILRFVKDAAEAGAKFLSGEK